MSRFINELKKMTKAAPQPMGFKTSRTAPSGPRILLVASLAAGEDIGQLTDGADAVLLRLANSQLTSKSLQKTAGDIPDIPWGAWLDESTVEKTETLVEAGCDFMVFPIESQFLAIPQDDKIGKILQVESSMSDSLLRAVNDLPVDSVLNTDVYTSSEPTSWHQLLLLQRLSNLLTRPLLAAVSPQITAGELKTLWEAGVDALVIETTESTALALKELHQAITKLIFRPPRKRVRAEALVPRIITLQPAEPEQEEEEGEQ